MTANQTRDLGIVNWVVPTEKLDQETHRLAQRLGNGPTEAPSRIKSLSVKSFSQSLDQHLQEESEAIAQSATGKNCEQGVKAFLEKREPKFHAK